MSLNSWQSFSVHLNEGTSLSSHSGALEDGEHYVYLYYDGGTIALVGKMHQLQRIRDMLDAELRGWTECEPEDLQPSAVPLAELTQDLVS